MKSELRLYIDMVTDCCNLEQLHEMANVGPDFHGINNVYIFVGSVEDSPHWLRIKVSNIPGKYDRRDNFVIQMPSLYYDPTQVANWITPKVMKKILDWVKLNQALLHDYELGIMTDTNYFLNSISKIT